MGGSAGRPGRPSPRVMWLLLFTAPAALAVEGALFGDRVHLLIGAVLALTALGAFLTVAARPAHPRDWVLIQTGLVLTGAALALRVRPVPYLPGAEVAWQRSLFHRDLAVVLCLAAAAACLCAGLRSVRPVPLVLGGVVLGAGGWQAISAAWQSRQSLSYFEDMAVDSFLESGVLYSSVSITGADFAYAGTVAAALLGPALLVLSRSRPVP